VSGREGKETKLGGEEVQEDSSPCSQALWKNTRMTCEVLSRLVLKFLPSQGINTLLFHFGECQRGVKNCREDTRPIAR